MLVREKRWQAPQADIAVFIDCEAQDRAAMLPVPARVVGSATKQGNAKGCSADYHKVILMFDRSSHNRLSPCEALRCADVQEYPFCLVSNDIAKA